MASILEFVLKGELSPDTAVKWLQDINDENKTYPEILDGLDNLRQEFVPFFLNYLRDHTIHLLQSSKSATPSPAKTPSLKKIQKSVRKKRDDNGKRQQLFGASPAGDVEDLKCLPESVFSPNTSLDSPSCLNIRHEHSNSKGNYRSGYVSQKMSPQCGSRRSPHSQHTPDQQRSKQKFSLGEFLVTPDNDNNGWKKKSPHSGNRRDFSIDNSPSPVLGRKSGGGRRKHASSPLVQTFSNQNQEQTSSPVFILTSKNDFPPVENIRQSGTCSQEKKSQQQNRRSLELKQNSYKGCDKKTSRVINFSNPDQCNTDTLQEVKRMSPVTVCASNSQKKTPTQLIGDSNTSPSLQGTRRITPTLVKVENSGSQNTAFLVSIEENVASKNFDGSQRTGLDKQSNLESTDGGPQGLSEERELLKMERLKLQTTTNDSGSSLCHVTPSKSRLEHSTSVVEFEEALLSKVTQQDKLDLLVDLYSMCLQCNLLPNLVVELYFLVQLLTARGGEADNTDLYEIDVIEENYFALLHNTVYFAVSVLELQKSMLVILDRSILRLLLENPRIAAFSTSLLKYLEELYEHIDTQKGPAYLKSPIGSVSFQADTDNRKSFPNDKAFHNFKRQRDGFYELIREWEASRMNPNYNKGEMFGGRVRALVNMMTDLANLIHFSRLFQSQLIAMCKGDGSIHTKDDDEDIALLSQLKRTNPAKFKRLQERFIKPLSTGGPCPLPTFPGIQEFFRDFIVVASSPLLNQHLCDTFAAKVSELNETTFDSHDEEDAVSSNGDTEDKDIFASLLLSVRLLGKFLGFVTFLPYQSRDKIPDTIESTYLTIRNQHQPALNLLHYLCTAIESGTLTLTVPWVAEFLSMADPMAPNLSYFQTILYVLLYIHRYMWKQIQEEMFFGGVLLVAIISWLFENPIIPDGFFFSEIPEDVLIKVQGQLPSLASMDHRNFVDLSLLYKCCPYLGELRCLLVEFVVGSNNKMSAIRKITPVIADVPKPKSITNQQLQLQMEENFFHNHPASMKRVVDFVADRTASNYIKKFRATLLPDSLTTGKERTVKQMVTVAEGSPTSKLKDKLSVITNRMAQDLHIEIRHHVGTDAPSYCEERTHPLMKLLLPDDQSDTVVAMASTISVRISMEKITQWMNKHITVAMYQVEILPDIEKIYKLVNQSETLKEVPVQGNNKTVAQSPDTGHVTADCHNDSLQHPSEVLIKLKDYVKFVSQMRRSIQDDEILEMLSLIRQTLNSRQDILPAVKRAFTQLTVELLLSLFVESPSNSREDVVAGCLDLWSSVLKDSSLTCLFSGRVVLMLDEAQDSKLVWDLYTKLLLKLVNEKLIEPVKIQETCLKFLPHIQSGKVVSSLCECLCAVAEALPEDDRPESLGACLELVYDMLPKEDLKGALNILEVLKVASNNNITVSTD